MHLSIEERINEAAKEGHMGIQTVGLQTKHTLYRVLKRGGGGEQTEIKTLCPTKDPFLPK